MSVFCSNLSNPLFFFSACRCSKYPWWFHLFSFCFEQQTSYCARRAIRLIGDPALTSHLQPLSRRRAVAAAFAVVATPRLG
nr:unnamed protein product [Callosobruchus chinensis]